MPRKEFTVGNSERHTIAVDQSFSTGDVEILLDGKKVPPSAITESNFAPGYVLPTRTLYVGEKEKHMVVIEFETGLPPFISVYVDGQRLEKD